MSEIDAPPNGFWWNGNLDATALRNSVASNNARILSLKTFVDGGHRRFASIWIADGKHGDWDSDITVSDLKGKMGKTKRLVSLDAFDKNGKLRCAGAWIEDTSVAWGWEANQDAATMKSLVDPTTQRPICLRRHMHNGSARYSAIWIDNLDNRMWGWRFDATTDEIAEAMNQNSRLVSLDTWNAGGEQRYAVIWNDNPGPVWFWNLGISPAKQGQLFDGFCSYGVDLAPWAADASSIACVMHGFPWPVDNGAVDQLAVSGSAKVDAYNTGDASRAAQLCTVDLTLTNLTGAALDLTRLRFRSLSSGGYILDDAGAFDRGPLAGQPSMLAAGATMHHVATDFGTPMAANALQVRIKTAQGAKHQHTSMRVPIAPLTGSAVPVVATTPDPVFVGLWANPIEILPLWIDGAKHHWVTIAGQVVNSFPEVHSKLTVVRVHLRLHGGGKTLIDEDLDTIWTVNADGNPAQAKDLASPVTTERQTLLFIVGRKLPTNFKSGTLELTLNYKLGDFATGTCGGFMQEWPAELLAPHTGTSPVKGTWHFGNAYAHAGWDGHASWFQRFSLDISIIKNNDSKKPDTPGHPHPENENTSFWAFNQPFYAIEQGKVVSWEDTQPDNPGRNPSGVWDGPLNYVVVESEDGRGTAGYFHLKQGSLQEKFKAVGAPVAAGELLAHVGNAGQTTEPHLHFGYLAKPDVHGRADMFPVQFTGLVDADGHAVQGALSNGDYKS